MPPWAPPRSPLGTRTLRSLLVRPVGAAAGSRGPGPAGGRGNMKTWPEMKMPLPLGFLVQSSKSWGQSLALAAGASWVRQPSICTVAIPARGSTPAQDPPRASEPPTCAWGGRLPPRLYHVIWVWANPATTQLRSSVCPSVTDGDEDSILTGGELAPEAGVSRGKADFGGALACPPTSSAPRGFAPDMTNTWMRACAVPMGLVATQR